MQFICKQQKNQSSCPKINDSISLWFKKIRGSVFVNSVVCEFLAEVAGFKEVLAKATHPIDVEELKVVMPDNAEKFIGLCDPEATDETFQTTFAQGEMFDKPGLVHLKESVTHVLENRLKQVHQHILRETQVFNIVFILSLKRN